MRLLQMEEVCLNSVPVFDENEDYDLDGNSFGVEETPGKKEPPNPTVGLEFDSFEEAYDFYNAYARNQGFGIRVSNSWFRSKRKERYRAKLSCSSAGFKKKSEANNPRPETRTGCPAMVVIRLVDSTLWRIIEVELGHNHDVSPQTKRFYKSHKRMIEKARRVERPVTELHTIRLYRTAEIESGRRNGCSDRRSRRLELGEGDSQAVYNFFCRMKLTDPGFVYLMDFDGDGLLRNVFWADSRSRNAYGHFCDAIAVDTTCLANKYEIPLVYFAGVNHHGESVLLGCGFLGHESAECFVWMIGTWLKCMNGLRRPRVIVTDQCELLRAAISEVVPDARHCYCSRYIMQRVPEKLGGLKGFEAIKTQLNKAVYGSLKISEFEAHWGEMVSRHGLEDNKWLRTLHEERSRWVPVYLKDVFFAGTIPTREDEGSAAFYFDGFIHKHTSFKEFVDKYDLARHRKLAREAAADTEPRSSLEARCKFESQASKAYTKEIFTRFRSEVEGMYGCFDTRRVGASGAVLTFVVKERVGGENGKDVKSHEVLYDASRVEIRCICSLFNYKGYLCRHALSVLNYNGVEEIPSRYILPRWSRDFKCGLSPHREPGTSLDWFSHLNELALPVVEQGAKSREHYETALKELEALLNKLSVVVDDDLVVT